MEAVIVFILPVCMLSLEDGSVAGLLRRRRILVGFQRQPCLPSRCEVVISKWFYGIYHRVASSAAKERICWTAAVSIRDTKRCWSSSRFLA